MSLEKVTGERKKGVRLSDYMPVISEFERMLDAMVEAGEARIDLNNEKGELRVFDNNNKMIFLTETKEFAPPKNTAKADGAPSWNVGNLEEKD